MLQIKSSAFSVSSYLDWCLDDSLSEHPEATNKNLLRKAIVILIIGEIGYWLYSAAPQATDIGGKAFLPQAIGMVIVAVIYGLMKMKNGNPFTNKDMVTNYFWFLLCLCSIDVSHFCAT